MRKYKLLVLLFYCSIVLLLTNCAKREIKNTDSKGKNIICFGDSITFGYGAEQGEDYPAELSKMVNPAPSSLVPPFFRRRGVNIPVINAGMSSDTSTIGLIRIETDVLNKEPLLVIIEFCGNDFIKRIPKEETIKNIEKMIDLCQQRKAMVALVDISAGMFFGEYRSIFSKIAHEKQAIFIPAVLNRVLTNPIMKSDFLHPNASGYKLIAQRIYKAIKPYLKKNANSADLRIKTKE